ncbi:MAG: prepilin-type N-terminal cleavage/methylation domain-containing protein [Armatimonadetes bacterium]|nr:prepilin-type N-terminal cleavage/methylation domain-containing protein [Armatimonadota bacterium]
MKSNRCGFTLMELIFAMAISSIVLGVGYQLYAITLRSQDVECARETAMLSVQNAMARIKSDVRTGSSVHVNGGELRIQGENGLVVYRNKPGAGVERMFGRSHVVFKDVTAKFAASRSGVGVDLRSSIRVHRRPIRIEISSFVSPRNL